MKRLLLYRSTIYDANCLIYYCFHHTFLRRDGSVFVLQSDNCLTPLVRRITENLVESGRTVSTIQVIIAELNDVTITSAVKKRVSETSVRRAMGLGHIDPFPADLRLQVVQKIRKTLRKLQARAWFVVEEYQPEVGLLLAVTAFFRNVAQDPALSGRRHPSKGMPSQEDLALILYSRDRQMPILTNDSDITAFRSELVAQSLLTEAIPLQSVQI